MGSRSTLLGFFLYAGIAFAALGAYLMFQGTIGGSVGTTFLLMGVIWMAVAIGVKRFYGKMAAVEQAERELFSSGTRATGTVESVEMTGVVLNRINHQIDLRIRIEAPDGTGFIHERRMYVPMHGIPQPGDTLDVAFDPRDHSKVALASNPNSNTSGGRLLLLKRASSLPAASDAADDALLEQLERLEQLRVNGTLTQAEFETQKARILNATPAR